MVSYLIFGILVYLVPLVLTEIQMVGHLAFIANKDSPVTINPKIINFYRRFDLALLEQSLNTLNKFGQQYEDFCLRMTQPSQRNASCVIFRNQDSSEKDDTCSNISLDNYEVKTTENAEVLRYNMEKWKIDTAYAPIKLEGHRLMYISGGENQWKYVKSCQSCPIKKEIDMTEIVQHKARGSDVHFFYEMNGKQLYILTVYKHPKTTLKYNIVCAVPGSIGDSTFIRMAKYSCRRDATEIDRTNEMLIAEYKQIASPTVSKQKRSVNGLLLKRCKRVIPLIGAGILGMEAVSNVFLGRSPLSDIGKGISYTLGIATHSDLSLTRKELDFHAQALSNLTINHNLLLKAHSAVQLDIQRLADAHEQTQHEIAVLFGEMDNKVSVYRLQQMVQNTLIKMVAAIQSGKALQTSPYVFGESDLHNLTAKFRFNNVPLTANINDIITTVQLVENSYTFIISVPIVNMVNHFHLYEVKALPVFREGNGYRVDYKYEYLAINSATLEYVALSETEYRVCSQYPLCTVHTPFRKIDHKAPCEIRSLKYKNNVCPVKIDDTAKAAYLTVQNKTYFSVPSPLDIHLTCTQSDKEFNEHKTISDYGFFVIPSGCEVSIGTDVSIRPGFVAGTHNLQDNTLFQILKVPDSLHEFPTKPNTTLLQPRQPITFNDVHSFADGINLVFDHETTIGEIIRILTYIAIFIAILLIFYCTCRPFRLWLNGCCFCTKPTVYWRKIRGYATPDFQRQNKIKNNSHNEGDKSKSLENVHRAPMTQFAALTQRVKDLRDDMNIFAKKNTAAAPNESRAEEMTESYEMPPPPPSNFHTLHFVHNPNRKTRFADTHFPPQ